MLQRRTRRLARNDVLRSSRIAVDGRLKRCFVGCSPGWWGDGRPEDTLMKLIIVAGASAIVGAVAIGLYVVTRTGAVCPVQNEAFYDHFYAKTLAVNSDTQKAAAIATYGAAVAARVVKEINERDGEVRQAYRDCVRIL